MTLIIPLLLMVTLTICVWVALYATRIPFMLRNNIDAQEWSQSDQSAYAVPLHLQNISNNFKNLFEAPILFYVLSLLMITTLGETIFDLTLGYAYVLARSAHSIIHCSYNRVMHRFGAYMVSNLVLVAMLISAFAKVFYISGF